MEKSQADAAAQAILEPHLRAQAEKSEEIRTKHATEAAFLIQRRRRAWFVLAGAGIGVVIAHLTGFRLTAGIACGGITGGLLGLFLARRVAA